MHFGPGAWWMVIGRIEFAFDARIVLGCMEVVEGCTDTVRICIPRQWRQRKRCPLGPRNNAPHFPQAPAAMELMLRIISCLNTLDMKSFARQCNSLLILWEIAANVLRQKTLNEFLCLYILSNGREAPSGVSSGEVSTRDLDCCAKFPLTTLLNKDK